LSSGAVIARVLGSGPAGYTAAIYAARAGLLEPIVIQGIQPGGQLTITTDVENYPGFADVIQGPWLMEQMQKQAEHVGTKIVTDHVNEVDCRAAAVPCSPGDSGEYHADTWSSPPARRRAGSACRPRKFKGFGVSACATCDGFFYRGKKVAVIGGGNTAVEEALYLTNHSHDVTLIHRRDASRREDPPGPAVRPSQHQDHLGQRSRRIRRRRHARGAGRPRPAQPQDRRDVSRIDVDGAFVAIGHKPATELFAGKLKLDSDGYIEVAPGTTRTSVDGVFACGDVMDKIYRQAVTAAGTGCMAALDADSSP
jgi:thioredoxin reductase (NADPH)